MTHDVLKPLPDSPLIPPHIHHAPRTRGERISDWIAIVVGSWRFILIQAALLVLWIALNILSWIQAWDPYPFILLNLVLSFQAAFTAPIIMMSQNRQNAIDRRRAENDYDVNVRAENEIEELHTKVDTLKSKDIQELIQAIHSLESILKQR